jgi:hypothetical protein
VAISLSQIRTQISDRPNTYPPASAAPEVIGIADGVATQFSLSYENAISGTLTIYAAPAPAPGAPPTFTALPSTPPVLLATTVPGAIVPGVNTLAPTSMANITAGAFLLADVAALGIPEVIQVASTTGATFTAHFAYPHAPGTSIVGAPPYSVGSPSAGLNGTAATAQVITFNVAPTAGTIIGARYQATVFSDDDLQAFLTRAQAWSSDDGLVLKRVHADILAVVLSDQRRLERLSQGDFTRDPAAYVNGLNNLRKQLMAELVGYPDQESSTPQMLIGAQRTRMYTPRR